DPFARALHRLHLRIGGAWLFGAAALAGAGGRFFGLSAGLEECDVLAFGGAGGAARPAIDSGRAHGEQELAVESGIAALDRLPSLFVAGWRPRRLRLARFGHGARHKRGSGVCLVPRLRRSVGARTPML